ncbi:MAG: S8 family serine peptidase [Polyangiaceae bacterium]
MKKRQSWIRGMGAMGVTASLAALLSGGGCDGKDPPIPDEPEPSACFGDLWIGRSADGDCPSPKEGWLASKLFEGAVEAPLSEFCLYEWQDDVQKVDLKGLPALGQKAAEEWLSIDCAAVGSLGAGKTEQALGIVQPPLWSSFMTQIDAPGSVPVPASPGEVEVAIIDSWPSLSTIGESPHGFGMGAIVDGLTCGQLGVPVCPVRTKPYLSLNLLGFRKRDNIEGGYFGHFGRLARQIFEAVRDFEANAGDDDRLILNLSVGWDEVYNPVGELAVQAVHEAIRWATCKGALVIAAAGNTSGGTEPGDGPTYPAVWQSETLTCAGCGPAGECPMLYSVAGVDGADLPLANARPGALPALVAPAFAVPGSRLLFGASDPSDVGPFTGSSVAAASASGVAAMVWLHDRNLAPLGVMNRLHSTGVDLGLTPEACPAVGGCPSVHRLSLCGALAASGANLVCAPPPAFGGSNASLSLEERNALGALVDSSNEVDGTGLTDVVTACGSEVRVPAGASDVAAASACPQDEKPSSLRNVGIDPQPGPDPCPVCTASVVKPATNIILEMCMFEGLRAGVTAQVMTLLGPEGNVVERYDLAAVMGGREMLAGETYRVTLPWNGQEYGDGEGEFRTAVVEWLDETESISKTSQLIVTIQE